VTAVGPVRRPRLGSPAHAALFGWQSRAECRGEDLALFFDPDRQAEAVEICGWCPVRDECLDWAIGLNIGYGVYGGMTADERKAERRRRMRRAAGAEVAS
jgi:WhiB family redox-sensing transcriptional regulator